MHKRIMLIIVFLLIIPIANAETTIRLKTLPDHEVHISIWDVDFTTAYAAPVKHASDFYGNVEHIYPGTDSPFGVMVIVKAFDITKYREKFGPYEAGKVIQLPDLLPEGFAPLSKNPSQSEQSAPLESPSETKNETKNETETPQNKTAQQSPPQQNEPFQNQEIIRIVYYIIGAAIIIGILSAIVVFIISKLRSPKIQYGMEPVKLSPRPRYDSSDKYLEKIEKEIEDVEQQIEQYKKRTRLEEAQKRLEEKKRILEQLKKKRRDI